MGLITYYALLKGKKRVGEELDIDKSCFELSVGFDALGLNGTYLVTGYAGSGELEAHFTTLKDVYKTAAGQGAGIKISAS